MNKRQTLLELGILLFAFLGMISADSIIVFLICFVVCAVLVTVYIDDEKRNGRW